ncbi:hypothetical protein [Streptomyces sp. H39-C1]|uniref:hypothetical protein n=1 Tax=Streptomyces sp. H39-C1 TaxID=3004355 RepID=UPI0022AF0C1C|nr:hypothetical protein [Streptomyces sp. H39-C1]MCZ4103672.1 hypothetical protein [Streptomyces sp. H39-C1]
MSEAGNGGQYTRERPSRGRWPRAAKIATCLTTLAAICSASAAVYSANVSHAALTVSRKAEKLNAETAAIEARRDRNAFASKVNITEGIDLLRMKIAERTGKDGPSLYYNAFSVANYNQAEVVLRVYVNIHNIEEDSGFTSFADQTIPGCETDIMVINLNPHAGGTEFTTTAIFFQDTEKRSWGETLHPDLAPKTGVALNEIVLAHGPGQWGALTDKDSSTWMASEPDGNLDASIVTHDKEYCSSPGG